MKLYQQTYLVPKGRCKKLLMLIYMCYARNQMWQAKRSRRDKFLAKAQPYISRKIGKLTKQLGFTDWRVERTGSENLYDVADQRNQAYRIYFWNKEQGDE